ncbi:MAG: UDP-N-acetylmuramoyl-tripeptide--D-alanyl-D-alanine ligase [Gemmatimonadaceae bacterium]
MTFWTLDRVTQALKEGLKGARPLGFTALAGIATDTRNIATGDVFVALRGERFDAHDFLVDAVSRGAAALVVDDATRCPRAGVPVFVVRDTTEALGLLARYRRRAWGKTVVAIAGSNGKTGTKALTAAALGAVYSVYATSGNLNNHIGVPLTLLALPDEADVAVVEIGTNHPGEVAMLRALAEPDVAVVTSIGEEHLEGFGDLAGVLREEGAVYEGVALGVAPFAQPEVGALARTLARRVVDAGLDSGDLHPDRWGIGGDGRGWMLLGETRVEMPFLGAHNLRNAVLAIAVSRALGVPDEAAARAISALPQLSMRSALETLGDYLLLSDCYNANPASAREALTTLDAIHADRPRVVVLGSMLELGASSDTYHDEIARQALSSKASVIAGVGEFQRPLTSLNDSRVVVAADADALWPLLRERIPPHALILLKGSRGTRLERLVPRLRELAGLPSVGLAAAPH